MNADPICTGWQHNPAGPPAADERAEQTNIKREADVEAEGLSLWAQPADKLLAELAGLPEEVTGGIDIAAMADQVGEIVKRAAEHYVAQRELEAAQYAADDFDIEIWR